VSLVARHLEANGIPTVILGAARDIVEECGVPRFVFTDFPLGNPCGKPGDAAMQRAIVELGLELLESARWPRVTVQSPFEWGDDAWRRDYMYVGQENLQVLRRAGERRRARQALRDAEGRSRSE
jgi:D-proline reductase (dithiol) PrdB